MSFPTSPPKGRPPGPWRFPPSHRFTLSNGLTVVVLPWHRLPIVQLRLVHRAGRWVERDSERGVARLMALTARHGTRRFDSATLASFQDARGIRLSSSISPDERSVGVKALSEHFDEALGVLAEVALHPSFPQEHLDRQVQQSIESRRHQKGDPDALAGEWFTTALYGTGHVYGRHRPEEDDLRARTREEVLAFHERHHGPDQAMLFVLGDVEPERAADLAERELGGWGGASNLPERPQAPTDSPARVILVDRPASEQATIVVGNLALERRHPLFDTCRVMNRVLGGGAASRLFLDLREQRSLTYGVSSSLDGGLWGGDFSAGLACSTDKVAESLSGLFEHLERVRTEAISEPELDAARRYIVGAFPQGTASLGGLASLLGSRWINRLPEDVWETFMARIAAVDADSAMAAAQACVRPSASTLVVVGRGDELEPVLAPYGQVERVAAGSLPR
jgi:zinc protease